MSLSELSPVGIIGEKELSISYRSVYLKKKM